MGHAPPGREAGPKGGIPYIIPRGSSTAEGGRWFPALLFELLDQAQASGFTPNAIAVTVGSSGTSGFLAGAHALAPFGRAGHPLYAFDTFGTDYPVQARERIMEHAEECWTSLSCPEDGGKAAAPLPDFSWGRAILGPTPA